jgi:hypothetical protein
MFAVTGGECSALLIRQQNVRESRLLGRGAVRVMLNPTFRRNVSLHLHGRKIRDLGTLAVMNCVFWDVTPFGSCNNRISLMMEAPSSSETSVLTRATRRSIPDDAISRSHRHENLKSYIALTGWTL